MLEESDGADWVYRRDPRIRRPLAGLGDRVLAPEVQLLYKHHAATPKDLADLRNVLPTLTPSARAWYDAAVSTPTFAPSSRPQR